MDSEEMRAAFERALRHAPDSQPFNAELMALYPRGFSTDELQETFAQILKENKESNILLKAAFPVLMNHYSQCCASEPIIGENRKLSQMFGLIYNIALFLGEVPAGLELHEWQSYSDDLDKDNNCEV